MVDVARICEMGPLPSRCSGAMTTTPCAARDPQKWEYEFLVPPRPWEKTVTGHSEEPFCGFRSGASREAGMVV